MQNKKAISLIVLTITIIVMIILASAIIMSLDNANIFNKAEEAVDKTNNATNKYLSELKLAERELEKIQGASKVTDANPGELSGKGTTDDPYLIESIDDLVAFSNEVNVGRTFEGQTVKLTRLLDFNSDNSYVDLNLKQALTDPNGAGFSSIGTGSMGSIETKPFKGIFDGDGAEIRNLYINVPKETEIVYVGLFGYTEDANIRNLGVTGKIIGEDVELNSGVKIAVTAGGIVGDFEAIEKTSFIENCYSKVDVYGSSSGGIAGVACGVSQDIRAVIKDCYNTGKISYKGVSYGNAGTIGGLISYTYFAEIDRCYNTGYIKNESENQAGSSTGGIVGYTSDTILRNVYNLGTIYSEDAVTCGGIIAEGNTNIIENAYNAGNMIVSKNPTLSWVGSCCGHTAVGTIINNCYNVGDIKVGGATIGYIYNVTINKLYYLDSELDAIASGTPLGEAPVEMSLYQMKSQSFVDTLNKYITDNSREDLVKWKMGANGYPTLDI